jgi:nicotinic acid mononucleotide adenylyltransferase
VRLVVVPRTGSPFDPESAAARKVLAAIGVDAVVAADGLATPAHGVIVTHAASLPISASDLRARAARGRSLAYRVPPPVASYITSRRLYGGPVA